MWLLFKSSGASLLSSQGRGPPWEVEASLRGAARAGYSHPRLSAQPTKTHRKGGFKGTAQHQLVKHWACEKAITEVPPSSPLSPAGHPTSLNYNCCCHHCPTHRPCTPRMASTATHLKSPSSWAGRVTICISEGPQRARTSSRNARFA